jgi:hypothetical protein
VVEKQVGSSTYKLVDSREEHELLEDLLEAAKPALPSGTLGLHWLLATPFRYPPLAHGSRFGSRNERSLWYGSDELPTALAEDAYYRLYFLSGSKAKLTPISLVRAAFQAHVRTEKGIDLTLPPFSGYTARLASPVDYSEPQALGSEMRKAGVLAFRSTSARDPKHGTNIGVFSPGAFASKKPLGITQTWQCTVTTGGDAVYEHQVGAAPETHYFRRTSFLVDGAYPSPAA